MRAPLPDFDTELVFNLATKYVVMEFANSAKGREQQAHNGGSGVAITRSQPALTPRPDRSSEIPFFGLLCGYIFARILNILERTRRTRICGVRQDTLILRHICQLSRVMLGLGGRPLLSGILLRTGIGAADRRHANPLATYSYLLRV